MAEKGFVLIIHNVWGKYSTFPLYIGWNRSTSRKTIASLSIIDRPQHAKTKASHLPRPQKKEEERKEAVGSFETNNRQQPKWCKKGKTCNTNISCAMQYAACLTSHVLSTENSASDYEFIWECLTFACRRLTPWFFKSNNSGLLDSEQ